MWSNVPDFLRLIPEILSSRHIENHICICYNACRQSEVENPCGSTKRKPQCGNTGVFYSHFPEGLNRRLVTDYLSPSNHLQMRWQITPAATAIISEVKNSMQFTSSLSPVSEAVTRKL